MRPAIGLTVSHEEGKMFFRRDYSDAVYRAGGIPLPLPYTLDDDILRDFTARIDGLLLPGGDDIDPSLFGEEPLPGLGTVEPERDRMEASLARLVVEGGKPVLAVCRGCQILCVALGGDMYQDLASQREGSLQHAQRAPRHHPSHGLQVVAGSLLNRITGWTTARVNSFHHQAVRRLPEGCRVCATAPDGVVEAFEGKDHPFLLALQWHPESMASRDPVSQGLFDAFVDACKKGHPWKNR